MKLKDFATLRRLMMQTTSDNDHEALQALRMANAVLAREGVDWDRVFGRLVTVTNDFEAAPDDGDPDRERQLESARIDAAFTALEGVRGGFSDFLTSLQDQWTKRRHLTERQKEVLFRAAARAEEEG